MWLKATAIIFLLTYLAYVPPPIGWKPSWKWHFLAGFATYQLRAKAAFEVITGTNHWATWRWLMQRDLYHTEGVEIKMELWDDVPVYIFKPEKSSGAGIVYFHGGGWTVGDIGIFSKLLSNMVEYTNAVLIAPSYRKAPENPFPAAFQDCYDVTVRFMKLASEFGVDPKRIALTGDSAGGNLAAAVTHHLSNQKKSPGKPLFQYLLYPSLQFTFFNLSSAVQFHNDPILSGHLINLFKISYLGYDQDERIYEVMTKHGHLVTGNDGKMNNTMLQYVSGHIPKRFDTKSHRHDISLLHSVTASKKLTAAEREHIQGLLLDPRLAPLSATDEKLRNIPKTFVTTCGADVLRDEGILYVERLRHVRADVTHIHLENVPHAFLSFSKFGRFSIDPELDQLVINYFENLKLNL